MSQFNAIDLSTLPQPDVIQLLNYEELFNQRKTEFNALAPLTLDSDLQPKAVQAEIVVDPDGLQYWKIPVDSAAGLFYLALESEPVVRLLQADVYRELLLRQMVNDTAHATMIAYATDADLDAIAARYNVTRLLITPATNTADAVYESDDALRKRTLLSLEALNTAGSRGSYLYHALSADGRVKDVGVDHVTFHVTDGAIVIDHDANLPTPEPGKVAITVLSHSGNGVAAVALLDIVEAALNDDRVRPLTDRLSVRSAEIVEYALEANITFYEGPSHAPVLALINQRLTEFLSSAHKVGFSLEESALHSVLHQNGVYKVEVVSPVLPFVIQNHQAGFCTGITLNDMGNHGF